MLARVLVIMFSLVTARLGWAQGIDSQIDRHLQTLRAAKVDTVALYRLSCDHEPLFPKGQGCVVYDTRYLYWVKHQQVYVQKFDNCYRYPVVMLKQSSYLTFYNKYWKTIEQETIKPVQTLEEGIISESHSCYHLMKFYRGRLLVKKFIDDFALGTVTVGGYTNVNYLHNQQTRTKALTQVATKEIAFLEGNQLFKQRK